MRLRYNLALLLLFLQFSVASQHRLDYSNYWLVLDEDFDYDSIYDSVMTSRWQYESHHKFWAGGIEMFSPGQLELIKYGDNSILRIRASLLDTPQYYGTVLKYFKSGMINYRKVHEPNCNRLHWVTDPPAGFTYGIFEMRAKIPAGNPASWDAWPAFWLTSFPVGEIDVIDAICADPGKLLKGGGIDWARYPGFSDNGWEQVGNTTGKTEPFDASKSYKEGAEVYYGEKIYRATRDIPKAVLELNDEHLYRDLSRDFHIYTVAWTENSLSFFLDGRELLTKRFDDRFDMHDCPMRPIINLSVIGKPNGTPSDHTANEMTMDIDYFRVYKPAGSDTRYMMLPANSLPIYPAE
jgi:hypothetical protein